MKVRFPLLAKILGWFFLNLLLLAAALAILFRAELRLGLDALLTGRAGERIRAAGELLVHELKSQPTTEWGTTLDNFGKAYKVDFLLFRNDGTQAAGAATELPPTVAEKVAEARPGGGLGRGPPPGKGQGRRAEIAATAVQPAFVIRAGTPAHYWVGVRLPLLDESQARPCPLVLLLVSHTLGAGGLYFDVRPWLAVGLGALVFSVLFWIPLVRSVTRSISQITRATEQIAEGRFEVRVDETRGDELGRLGLAINRMAGRLSGLVTGQKRFLGDTAHELCSPIARIQVALGILEEQSEEAQRARLADLREEVEQMASLVNELLSFSKASLHGHAVKVQPVQLAALAQRVIAREAAGDSRVEAQIDPSLQVLAEPELLSRALANLLRNALHYAGQAGPIRLSAEPTKGNVTITVTDQGPGVPEPLLHQIFDPFFRLEASRSRDTGGIGLGLAIVRTCVQACGGTVSARNRTPSGLEVTLTLQAAPRSPGQ